MAGSSGRRLSWAMSNPAAFERYESSLALYQGPDCDVAPPPGLAGKLHGLIQAAREQNDHTIAAALGDILAGLQRRIRPLVGSEAAVIANDP